jgi:hypothetical protein
MKNPRSVHTLFQGLSVVFALLTCYTRSVLRGHLATYGYCRCGEWATHRVVVRFPLPYIHIIPQNEREVNSQIAQIFASFLASFCAS